MAEPSSQTITVAAEPNAIMAVIADFEAYPEWTGAVKRVEVTAPGQDGRAERVRFTMDAGMIKDTYELAYRWAPDGLSVSWTLVAGQIQKAQQGSYVLVPRSAGDGPVTDVTYSLSVDLAIPMIGVLRRKAEKVVLNTALGELRRRVEAG
jgi:hypothetical protein